MADLMKRFGAFSPIPAADVIYESSWNTGICLGNPLNLFGGPYFVRLAVTRDEVLVTSALPLGFLFAPGMEHRIAKSQIIKVTEEGILSQAVVIEYMEMQGRKRQVLLNPRKPQEFKKALLTGMPQRDK